MTDRAKLAAELEEATANIYHPSDNAICERSCLAMVTAAAELRKTCATCKWFMGTWVTSTDYADGLSGVAFCKQLHRVVPRDGSGFCYQWRDGAK